MEYANICRKRSNVSENVAPSEETNVRLIMKSDPARWANPGARMLHLYGRLLPSLEKRADRQSREQKKRMLENDLRNKVNGHLSFGRLDGAVGLAWGNGVSLAEELEVVNQRFHALLHHSARRRRQLVVVDLDSARRHLVKTLTDDVQALAHLLNTAQVSVIAVSVLSNRDVELDLQSFDQQKMAE